MDGWARNVIFFEGDDCVEILAQFEHVQDLSCLVRMGRFEGTKNEQKELNRLEKMLNKYYSGDLEIADLEKFSFRLSIGLLRCIEVSDK